MITHDPVVLARGDQQDLLGSDQIGEQQGPLETARLRTARPGARAAGGTSREHILLGENHHALIIGPVSPLG